MHLIKCNEQIPTGQVDVRIGVIVNAKYRYEPLLAEPHVYKFMGFVITGTTKSHAIAKLQSAIDKAS